MDGREIDEDIKDKVEEISREHPKFGKFSFPPKMKAISFLKHRLKSQGLGLTNTLNKEYGENEISRRKFLKIMGVGAGGAVFASSLSLGALFDDNLLSKAQSTISGPTGMATAGNNSCGFSWDQTHTDTSWLTEAESNGNLNVEIVTSTDPDELESAASTDEPTVVVFEAGGVFDVDGGYVTITGDNTWIAGETAPDPGINVIRGGINVEGDNVIVSHCAAYSGDAADDPDSDSALDPDGNDVIFDHVTGAWGPDEVAGIAAPVSRVSFINCIITEGPYYTGHQDGGEHSRCITISTHEADKIAIMGTFMGNSTARHPQTKSDTVLVNNWVHNYGRSAGLTNNGREPDVDMIGCYYEEGPDSDSDVGIWLHSGNIYFEDVETEGHPLVSNGAEEKESPTEIPDGLDVDNDILSSENVPDFVLQNAGMRPASRPQAEQGIVERMKTGVHIDDESDVGGHPNYSETNRSLDIPSGNIVAWIKTNHTSAVENCSGTGSGSSTRFESGQHRIELSGGSSSNPLNYILNADTSLNGGSNANSEVFDKVAIGFLEGETHTYEYNGRVTDIRGESGITVTRDGEELSSDEIAMLCTNSTGLSGDFTYH